MGKRGWIAKAVIDALLLGLFGLLVWMSATGGVELDMGGWKLGLRSSKNPSILFFLLLTIRLGVFTQWAIFDSTPRAARFVFVSLMVFIGVVLVGKTIISLIALYYFHLVLDGQDWQHTFATDMTLALLVALVTLLVYWANQRLFARRRGLVRWVNVCLYIAGMGMLVSSILYTLVAYVFFEWGSFIEPAHILAMRMAGVGPEASDLFFRWRTLLALVLLVVVAWGARTVAYRLDRRFALPVVLSVLALLLLPFAWVVKLPVSQPHRVAPTVQSPLLMLLRPPAGNSNGLNARHMLATMKGKYTPYQPPDTNLPVKPEYQDLQGTLAGKNIVFFVMESVRYQNVGIYGYERDNMPTLSSLADNALVFEQGYITQPRSSKAFAALGIGMTPDPRLVPVAWHAERVRDADTFINRLIDDSTAPRRYFMGTAQPAGSDNVDEFFNAASAYRADEIATFETISTQPGFEYADQGLVNSFLRWTDKDEQPFLSVLWTECAHMPYIAPLQPFGDGSLLDRYDNCLYTVDAALKTLVEGLKARNLYEDTVLVVFGDHGEALGEKFDRGHGSYLYEHSMRIPLIVVNPVVFQSRRDVSARFKLKDLPATLLYMLGKPTQLYDSVNIFTKGDQDELYFSNVYQDFKLGLMRDQHKYVYRPTYDLFYMFDLEEDPDENLNVVNRLLPSEMTRLKKEMLSWYWHHTERINRDFPQPEEKDSQAAN